ncbi:DNA-binding protein [bacterium]|nr:DNA-binding protein [bacterium]
MEIVCVRLTSGAKLRESIYEIAQEHDIEAGIILTCLGSLQAVNIRLAGAMAALSTQANFEIISLTGTFNNCSQGHFHISVSDKEGNCLGGHLLDDNIVATTAEIVLGILPKKQFLREKDPETGYLELIIKNDLLR